MHGTSARHGRGEVPTGAAVEATGRPPTVSGREGADMNSGMEPGVVPAELVERWQTVYGEYIAADRLQASSPNYPATMARLSSEVASAWRDLAASPGLPWWLVASLTTSAEAFEQQAARDSSRAAGRPSERGSGPRHLPSGETWFGSASGRLDQRGYHGG